MRIILVFILTIGLAFSLSLGGESITNDLTSTTVGFWTLGTPAPSNGSPEAAPTGYTDADYVVVPVGTAEFSWQKIDGVDGEGVVTMWVYDHATSVEQTDLGHPFFGPWWGIKSGEINSFLTVGIRRNLWVAYDLGYYVYISAHTEFYVGDWLIDGLRGSHGAPFSAGWYKFGFDAHKDYFTIEVYDVDYFKDGDKSLALVHGTAVKSFDSGNSYVLGQLGYGYNGLAFKGDDPGGPENIEVAIGGGNGVFAGVSDDTAPIPKNVSSWGSVKALYR